VNKFISTFTNEEMTKIKVVDFEKLHNFVVENFFIGNCLGLQNSIEIFFAECQGIN
jgi:hypothetical protein